MLGMETSPLGGCETTAIRGGARYAIDMTPQCGPREQSACFCSLVPQLKAPQSHTIGQQPGLNHAHLQSHCGHHSAHSRRRGSRSPNDSASTAKAGSRSSSTAVTAAATSKASGPRARSMRASPSSKRRPTSAFVAAFAVRRGPMTRRPTSAGAVLCRVARSPRNSAIAPKRCRPASTVSAISTMTAGATTGTTVGTTAGMTAGIGANRVDV